MACSVSIYLIMLDESRKIQGSKNLIKDKSKMFSIEILPDIIIKRAVSSFKLTTILRKTAWAYKSQ